MLHLKRSLLCPGGSGVVPVTVGVEAPTGHGLVSGDGVPTTVTLAPNTVAYLYLDNGPYGDPFPFDRSPDRAYSGRVLRLNITGAILGVCVV